jgi:hypothetical protein
MNLLLLVLVGLLCYGSVTTAPRASGAAAAPPTPPSPSAAIRRWRLHTTLQLLVPQLDSERACLTKTGGGLSEIATVAFFDSAEALRWQPWPSDTQPGPGPWPRADSEAAQRNQELAHVSITVSSNPPPLLVNL